MNKYAKVPSAKVLPAKVPSAKFRLQKSVRKHHVRKSIIHKIPSAKLPSAKVRQQVSHRLLTALGRSNSHSLPYLLTCGKSIPSFSKTRINKIKNKDRNIFESNQQH